MRKAVVRHHQRPLRALDLLIVTNFSYFNNDPYVIHDLDSFTLRLVKVEFSSCQWCGVAKKKASNFHTRSRGRISSMPRVEFDTWNDHEKWFPRYFSSKHQRSAIQRYNPFSPSVVLDYSTRHATTVYTWVRSHASTEDRNRSVNKTRCSLHAGFNASNYARKLSGLLRMSCHEPWHSQRSSLTLVRVS